MGVVSGIVLPFQFGTKWSGLADAAGNVMAPLLTYEGMGISVFPYVVPWTITLWDAASSPGSQAFLLVGTLLILPIVFMYTGWSYYAFLGKVRADLGYH
jgi:cytochrome bd ubiquinol oxidase subunit II